MEERTPASSTAGPSVRGMLDVEELRAGVAAGELDTVLTCFTDMQGRLMGKRVDGDFFCDQVLGHGIEVCDYLLALDMEMDPVAGLRTSVPSGAA